MFGSRLSTRKSPPAPVVTLSTSVVPWNTRSDDVREASLARVLKAVAVCRQRKADRRPESSRCGRDGLEVAEPVGAAERAQVERANRSRRESPRSRRYWSPTGRCRN